MGGTATGPGADEPEHDERPPRSTHYLCEEPPTPPRAPQQRGHRRVRQGQPTEHRRRHAQRARRGELGSRLGLRLGLGLVETPGADRRDLRIELSGDRHGASTESE